MRMHKTSLHAGEGARKMTRSALASLFVTVGLDMLAMGIIAPVLPGLLETLLHANAALTAQAFGILGSVWAVMQFLSSPVLGALSDSVGRRPVILLSNLGLGLDYVVMACASSAGWLFVGRAVSGITSATLPTAMAYVADGSSAEERAANFGVLNAALGLGLVAGPALGGILGSIHPRLPFWVAGGCSLVNALYACLILPESLHRDRRRPFSWRTSHPLNALRSLRRQAPLARLAVSMFLGYVAHEAIPTVYVLYAGFRYGWADWKIGASLTLLGLCFAVVSASLIGPAAKILGEKGAIFFGLSSGTAGLILFGSAQNGWMFWTGIPLIALWGVAGPPVQAVMSRLAGESEQGQLQGALSSLQGIAGLLAPVSFSYLLAHSFTMQGHPAALGVPFFVAAALVGLAAVAAYSGLRPVHEEQ